MQRTIIMVGVVVFLGLSTGCGLSYEEQERVREAERRQGQAAQDKELADFAERYYATPVQLFPDWSGLGEELPRTFTAQLQEKIEGSVVAFRGELIDVVRTSENNYQLVFGSRILGLVVATLDFDRQGAVQVMDDPPDLFSELLVAARIDKVEPILLQLRPCSAPGCGERYELGIYSYFPISGTPSVRVFGTAIAVEE